MEWMEQVWRRGGHIGEEQGKAGWMSHCASWCGQERNFRVANICSFTGKTAVYFYGPVCQLDWTKGCPRQSIKHYFWVWLWGCFWKRLVFESVDIIKRTALTNLGGIIQLVEGLNRTGGGSTNFLSLFLSWDIHLLLPWELLALWSSEYGIYTSGPLKLTYTTSFPGLPACRGHISASMKSHEPIPMINHYNTHIYMYIKYHGNWLMCVYTHTHPSISPIGSVSVENPD